MAKKEEENKKTETENDEELEENNEIKQVEKVWGREIWIHNDEKYCGKKLILNKGKRCSLHYHKIKDETFYLESGRVLMQLLGEERIMNPGECLEIPRGAEHRFSGLENSVIFEFSTKHFDEDSYRIDGELSGDIPKEIIEKYKGDL